MNQGSKLYAEKQDFQQKRQDAMQRRQERHEEMKNREERLVIKEQGITGRVKTYNATKRFGFLVADSYPNDIFVYQTHLVGRIALQQGEEVVFDLVMDNGRPQGRNVRPTAPAKEDIPAADDAQQLFPKGTIVAVYNHPLDEWNGKQGTIQTYDRVQKHFVVDFGKMKLNLRAEFLRFQSAPPEEGAEAGEKKAEATGVAELDVEQVGYVLAKCSDTGGHNQLAADANEAVSITHEAGEWMYAYILADQTRMGWLHRDNFARQIGKDAAKVPPPPAPGGKADDAAPSNDTSEWEAVGSPEGDADKPEATEEPAQEKPVEIKGKEALDWLWSGRDKKP